MESEATVAPLPVPAERVLPEMTFEGLITLLASSDDSLVIDIDPAALVGEIRGKVDGIKHVIDRLEDYAARLKSRIDPLQKKKRSAETNAARLKAYVAEVMQKNHFDQVPGNEFRVQLQPNPPALEVAEAPSEAHRELFPEYVEEVRELRWKTEKLKDDLLTGYLPADACPFAKIRRGSHARFHENVPDKLPAKRRGTRI